MLYAIDLIINKDFLFTYDMVNTSNETWKMSVVSGRISEPPQCIDKVEVSYNGKKFSMNEDNYSYDIILEIESGTYVDVEFIFKENFNVKNMKFTLLMRSGDKHFEMQLNMEKEVVYE